MMLFTSRLKRQLPLFALLIGLLQSTLSFGFSVSVANAPANNLQLTVSAIQSAQKTLLINIYEMNSPPIVAAIENRIKAGVQVVILSEGQIVGGLSTEDKAVQSKIAKLMQQTSNDDHLYVMTSANGAKRRFHFDHGKYIVVDSSSLLIGSENYSPTGNPNPGSIGNRGWEVLINNRALALQFQRMFLSDCSLQYGDIIDLTQSSTTPTHASNLFAAASRPPAAAGSPIGGTQYDATAVKMIRSPDTSLPGLLGLINGAKRSIDIEQMTFDSAWAGSTGYSPLINAVVNAAKRGVKVRVLLNDERTFSGDMRSDPSTVGKNGPTSQILNEAAKQYGVDLEARIANVKTMQVDYVHNKGALVDGNQTLISSINWGQNSILRNREAAVILTSVGINQYYSALFNSDWDNSASTKTASMHIRSEFTELLAATDEAPRVHILATNDLLLNECPNKILVTAKIDEFIVDDKVDADFKEISGKAVEREFVRTGHRKDCIFSSEGTTSAIEDNFVLELRNKRNGSHAIYFEGYTPKSNKIYSIRSALNAKDTWEGTHSATVYNSSGPARDRLGNATMTLKIEE